MFVRLGEPLYPLRTFADLHLIIWSASVAVIHSAIWSSFSFDHRMHYMQKEDDHYITTCISRRKVIIRGIPDSRALQRQHDENAVEDVDDPSNIIAVNESHMS